MNFKEISGSDLENNLDSYVIYDVRSKEEYKLGHIKGAINIPHDEVAEHIDVFRNLDKPIVLHCRTNNRSFYAASILQGTGIDDITIAPGVAYYDYKLTK